MTAATPHPQSTSIGVRDLMTLGVFTALYVVAAFIPGMLGFVPILLVAMPFLIAVLTGIPFMLFATRVHSFGLVSLMGVFVGLVMFLIGEGWPSLVLSVVFGVLADLIMRVGGYRRWSTTLLGFGVFTAWSMATMLPIWVARDSFMANQRAKMGDDYVDQLAELTPSWVFWVVLASMVVGVVVGGALGRATLRKHFVRAGIA